MRLDLKLAVLLVEGGSTEGEFLRNELNLVILSEKEEEFLLTVTKESRDLYNASVPIWFVGSELNELEITLAI